MKALVIGALAALGTGYTVTQGMDGDAKPVELRVEAAAEGIVTILIPTGEVTVEGWDNDEIEVVGTLSRDDAHITLLSDHGHAELSLLGEDPTVLANLHVRIPHFSNLDIETTNADFTVAAFSGIVRFESANGSLIVDGEPRGVVARSVTGDIEIPAANIPGFAHSEEGFVRLGPGTATVMDQDPYSPHHEMGHHRHQFDHIGDHISETIAAALEGVHVEAFIGYDHAMDELDVELSGRVSADFADLEELFEDMSELMEDIEHDIGEEMELLEQELEQLGEQMHIMVEKHKRHRHRVRR